MVIFFRRSDSPQEKIEKLIKAVNNIDGINDAHRSENGPSNVIEFRMPDQDPLYPSSIVIGASSADIEEVTLRLGPLGDRSEMTESEIDDVAGQWVDVVLDSASEVGIIDVIGSNFADLGDRWIDSKARPHVRMHRREEGYDIRLKELVEFIETLAERFDNKFGTLEDRMMDPEFAGNFEM